MRKEAGGGGAGQCAFNSDSGVGEGCESVRYKIHGMGTKKGCRGGAVSAKLCTFNLERKIYEEVKHMQVRTQHSWCKQHCRSPRPQRRGCSHDFALGSS